tara:strand:- start:1444 stop:1863 length:420 start_codon:yes stop_codon:yes gene_type:complete
MPKKKFSDTKVGKFLDKIAPHIYDVTASIIPDAGILNLIKGLIKEDKVLTPETKEQALKLLEMDLIEMQEITKRWDADMKSDSWLSKNVRPLTLVFFSLSYVTGWFLEYPLDSITGLLSLIVAAYFGSRGFEKLKALGK